MRKLVVTLSAVVFSSIVPLAACTDGDGAQAGAPVGPAVDAGPDRSLADAAALDLDPKRGSFAGARNAIEAILLQGRDAELLAADRFVPLRDPLLVIHALAEVQRAAATVDCLGGQLGCPDATNAAALLGEFQANEAALAQGLESAVAAQHAWGRVGVASILIGLLHMLEQAGALDASEISDIDEEADRLVTALTSAPLASRRGMYPDVPPNAPLYRLFFSQVPPAPAPAPAHVAAVDAFVEAVFARLGVRAIGPKPEDPLGRIGGLLGRLRKALADRGLSSLAIVAQGSEAAQVMDALPFYVNLWDPGLILVERVDKYVAALDDIVTKAGSNTMTDADWSKYAAEADDFASTLDVAASALGSSLLAPAVAEGLKDPGGELEVDPNVTERVPTSKFLRKDPERDDYALHPLLRLVTSGPVMTTLVERRAPTALPDGVAPVELPLRTFPTVSTADLVAVRPFTHVGVRWEVLSSRAELDHVDVRIENLTTKKRVFHKVYRRDGDGDIAVGTVVPIADAWFERGVNDLEIRAVAVDRNGLSSGVACGSLSAKLDAVTGLGGQPSKGTCFRVARADADAPFSLPPAGVDAAIGNYGGSPYRPGLVVKQGTVRIHNDSTKPRRLRSLFTPDYTEFLSIDPAIRKVAGGAGVPPIDTGVIAAGGFVDVVFPEGSSNVRFSLVDDTSAPNARLVLYNQTPSLASYW